MRWDREAPPESNLHVYGKDDIEFRVYNMKKSQKRTERKKETGKKVQKNKLLKKKGGFWTKLICLSCLGYTEDSFCILIS